MIRTPRVLLAVVFVIAAAAALAACNRERKDTPMLSDVSTAKYHAGETWKYKTRPGEEGSILTVVKVESSPRLGIIVHVSLDGLNVRSKHAPSGTSDRIGHMPFSEAAIDASVTGRVGKAGALPKFEDGYKEWRAGYDQGKAGIFSVPVAEAVGYTESILQE
jgi:hypothetical protein